MCSREREMAGRDWASLPSPLLCSVAERLIPASYSRLRAVCTSWCSAVSPEEGEEGRRQPYYLPRSLCCPWLMVTSKDDEPTGSVTFLSLPESLRPYRIAAPELLNKRIVGSHAGWLAAVDPECNMSLINPLTRSQIPLPSITTLIPWVEVVCDPSSGSPTEFVSNTYGNKENYTPDEFRQIYFRKVILSSSPTSSPHDYIVVLIFHYMDFLAFARAGDTAWSFLADKYSYTDAVFLGQKLYSVSHVQEILVYDFSETVPHPAVVVEKISDSRDNMYLVFSSGDLLLVMRTLGSDTPTQEFITLGFTVEKIDLIGQGKKRPVPIKDIGCRSLFVGTGQSLSISTQEISGLRHNCIYFTDDYLDWFFSHGKQSTRDMGVFDIKEESFEPLYPPHTWLTCPPPIWFAPVPS